MTLIERIKEINWDRFFLYIIGISIVIIGILYIITMRSDHDWGGDFALYLLQAKSLVEFNYWDYSGISRSYGNFLEPWGYPLLLAPILSIFGLNVILLKIATSFFFILSLVLIFLLFNNKISKIYLLLLILIVGLNPHFFSFKDQILPDFPFLFSVLISIYLIQRVVVQRKPFINYAISYMIIASSIFISFLIRYPGIILVVVLFFTEIISLLINKREGSPSDRIIPSHACTLLPYFLFTTLFAIHFYVFPVVSLFSRSSYMLDMSMIVHFQSYVFFIINTYIPGFHQLFVYSGNTPMAIFIYAISLILFLIGVTKSIKKDFLYVIFILCYSAVIVLYAYFEYRYLFPIIPFYLYFCVIGLLWLSKQVMQKFGSNRDYLISIPILIAIIIFSGFGISYIYTNYSEHDFSQENFGPYQKENQEIFDYIKVHTTSKDAVVFFKPSVMKLYSGTNSSVEINYNSIMNSDYKYFIDSDKDDLYSLYGMNKSIVNNMLLEHQDQFVKVFENKNFRIFEIRREVS
jgi:hypothetical protein